jgi:hypothetical protein
MQTFLQQMAEGGARPAPTVVKELFRTPMTLAPLKL